ncbi:hypothetical protein RIF29_16720 [Crotalaria pallida]|uniref:Uncharacterized protein n=1 Tax=Crotalaria pallida TaxID=3830 RepID=A0AAN9FHV7_CROPI
MYLPLYIVQEHLEYYIERKKLNCENLEPPNFFDMIGYDIASSYDALAAGKIDYGSRQTKLLQHGFRKIFHSV